MAHDALAAVAYGDDPPVCVLGDSADAAERMRKTAEAAGCRVAGGVRVGAGAVRDCVPGAALLVELDGAAGEDEAEALLGWAEGEAESAGRRVLVSSPAALIDLVAGYAFDGRIYQLADAHEAERIAAVRLASRPAPPILHDIGREEGPAILQQLTQDVGRIAAMLASLSEEEAAALVQAKSEAPDKDEPQVDAGFVRAIIRARRLRDQYIRGGLFADPAWDMLLDLMAARLEGNRVAVSSLCIAAAVPATTALRWIRALTDRGLFIRSADPQDGRRVYIELSDDVAWALTAYLRAVRRSAPAAI